MHAHRVVLMNFFTVLEGEHLMSLCVERLLDYVQSDELEITSEEHMLSAVARWVEFDALNRAAHLVELLQSVRLEFIHPQVLEQFLPTKCASIMRLLSPSVQEQCKSLLSEALLKNFYSPVNVNNNPALEHFFPNHHNDSMESDFADRPTCSTENGPVLSVNTTFPATKRMPRQATLQKESLFLIGINYWFLFLSYHSF